MFLPYPVLKIGLLCFAGCGVTIAGCALDSSGLVGSPFDGSGTGGLYGAGGTLASGGRTGSGGLGATGGRGASGGQITGGATSSGGRVASGGAAETGGRGTGGRVATGGRGGLSATGGAAIETGGQGGTPGGCGPTTCPNGCCDGNSCITNRGRMSCGNHGIACAPCADCFQCSDAGTCDVNPSSKWAISCRSATITPTKPGGAQWDPAPGLEPDPVCEFQIDEIGQRDSSVQTDTFTPDWDELITPGDLDLTASWLVSRAGSWSILVADNDGMDNEEICQVHPTLTASNFTTGTVQFSNTRACTSLTVQLVCDD